MKVQQGDIIDVNFPLPEGGFKPHPAIVISNDDLQIDEDFFYCVMISTKDYNPTYYYELKDDMLTKPMKEKSYVKCQIIGGLTESDVIKKYGKVKNPFLQVIIDKIINSIF